MNFERIPPVETSKHFLDLAFRKARRKGMEKNLKGNWLQIIRKKEGLKLDIIKDSAVPRLEKILQDFPDFDHLPEFYIKLMRLTLNLPELKKSLGSINGAIKRIRLLHKDYVSKITKTKENGAIKELSRQFYGRFSSMLKRIDPHLKHLEECRKIMKSYPDIKEMFTVCIYGFPNVGKTTLLNKLTKTEAKVAAYAFTTKTINAGYLVDNKEIQILDVPGTLARTEKMNKIELQADLVLKELADVIIYVFDLSESCGYSVIFQDKLLKIIKNSKEITSQKKKILIYLSKTDLSEGKPLPKFKYKHYSLSEIKEEILKLAKQRSLE